VPADGVRASWRARRLPCQLRPYFLLAFVDRAAEKLFQDLEVYLALGEGFGEQLFEVRDVILNDFGRLGFWLSQREWLHVPSLQASLLPQARAGY